MRMIQFRDVDVMVARGIESSIDAETARNTLKEGGVK